MHKIGAVFFFQSLLFLNPRDYTVRSVIEEVIGVALPVSSACRLRFLTCLTLSVQSCSSTKKLSLKAFMQIKDLNIFRLEVFGKILIGRGENMFETALLKPDKC